MSVVEQTYKPWPCCGVPINVKWPREKCWRCLRVAGTSDEELKKVIDEFEAARGPLVIMNPYPPLLLPPP